MDKLQVIMTVKYSNKVMQFGSSKIYPRGIFNNLFRGEFYNQSILNKNFLRDDMVNCFNSDVNNTKRCNTKTGRN